MPRVLLGLHLIGAVIHGGVNVDPPFLGDAARSPPKGSGNSNTNMEHKEMWCREQCLEYCKNEAKGKNSFERTRNFEVAIRTA